MLIMKPKASPCRCLVLVMVFAVSGAIYLNEQDRHYDIAGSNQIEQRSKRAAGYTVGRKASLILLEGALQVMSTVPGKREYMKFGSVKSAFKDFYNVNPDNVRITKLKNGGYGRLGEVGDKTIELKSHDRSGRPSVILTSKQADKTQGSTTIEKITYVGDAEF